MAKGSLRGPWLETSFSRNIFPTLTAAPPARDASPRMEIRVESDAGTRLDAFLASKIADLSRSRLQELIRE